MKDIRATPSVLLLCTCCLPAATADTVGEPPDSLASIQAAIDENGGVVRLSDVHYEIDAPITIAGTGVKLIGPATIVQTNPDVPIIKIVGARDVLLRDLSLTRSAATQKTDQPDQHVPHRHQNHAWRQARAHHRQHRGACR